MTVALSFSSQTNLTCSQSRAELYTDYTDYKGFLSTPCLRVIYSLLPLKTIEVGQAV